MRYYLLLLILVSLCPGSVLAGPLPDAPHIVTTGLCKISAVPDIVALSLSIAETGFEVAEARNQVEARSKQLITALLALSIAKKDINSAQLQITPHYNWNNKAQIYAGTEVSRSVEVTLRDLSRYDQLIRAIVDSGVARIQSTQLSSSQETKYREEAMRGAIEDGMRKAQLLVASLPEHIGPVYSIVSQSAGTPPIGNRSFRMAEAAGQSAFEPGTITFSESLQLVFYLVKEK